MGKMRAYAWRLEREINEFLGFTATLFVAIHTIRNVHFNQSIFLLFPPSSSTLLNFFLLYFANQTTYYYCYPSGCKLMQKCLNPTNICHLDRVLNDEFNVKSLFWFLQLTPKSDLKVVQITKNDVFWVNAPLYYLECSPNCKTWPQLKKITITNI